MSRVNVTLRLCWGQAEQEGGRPVEVKCSGLCDSGDVGRRRWREGCIVGENCG